MNPRNYRYTSKKKKLVVVGDVHGNWTSLINFCANYRDYCIIQVGDFGSGFLHPTKEHFKLKSLNGVLHQSNNELLVIRGNHDKHSNFNGKWKNTNILFCEDYHIINIENKKIQIVGGGISIDRLVRKDGRDWWFGEEVNYVEGRIEECDILISHVAPTVFPLTKAETNPVVETFHKAELERGLNLIGELNNEKDIMQKISDNTKCKKHIFGHYHRSMTYHDSETQRDYYCLDIDEFREISLDF